MADPILALAAVVVFVVPGLWLSLSGTFDVLAARRADRTTPTPTAEVSAGRTTVTGPANPLFPDDALPAPLSSGLALCYTYRVVAVPDPDASVESGEPVASGTAAVPFVVGSGEEAVLAEPTGAELHLDGERTERFEGDPPERIADFLDFQGIDRDGSDSPIAVAVRVLHPGDDVYVTGVVERIAEGTAEEFPGDYVVQSGTDRVPLVVADRPGAGSATGQAGRGAVKVLVGLGMLVPGLLFASLYGFG